jgi:two-component system, LytTR family, sensor histidine kinase AlgZ
MTAFIYRYRVAFLHLSFWCVYLSLYLYQTSQFWQSQGMAWPRQLALATVSIGSTVLISYVNYCWLLPGLLTRKKVLLYSLQFMAVFGVIIAARVFLERYLIDDYARQVHFIYSSRFVIHISAVTLFIVLFVAMLRIARDWFELQARTKTIENERLSAELNFLKAQINPHFLFNTLNNLYYLAFTQSPNTTEVIEKLSQMMRYMIYDSNHNRVLLQKEIDYMQNYISLERLRLNNHIPIKFELEGNPDGVFIAPLIFITFLENAFKHGVSNNNPQAWINICIRIQGKACTYTVENSKLPLASASALEKSGIGLLNVRRRLELSYPGQFDLQVQDQDDRYYVQLKLNLN